MAFSIRPSRRFPVYCHVTYHAGLSEGNGTIWNVSLNGQERVLIATGIVRWVRGDDYGIETHVANAALNQMARFEQQVEHEPTQLNGGYYGLNTPEVDSFSRSARLRTPCRPANPDTDC